MTERRAVRASSRAAPRGRSWVDRTVASVFLVMATYVLVVLVIGRALAHWAAHGLVLAAVAALLGVAWASIFAASLSMFRGTPADPIIEPVLRTRGLAVLGVMSIVLSVLLVYGSRSAG